MEERCHRRQWPAPATRSAARDDACPGGTSLRRPVTLLRGICPGWRDLSSRSSCRRPPGVSSTVPPSPGRTRVRHRARPRRRPPPDDTAGPFPASQSARAPGRRPVDPGQPAGTQADRPDRHRAGPWSWPAARPGAPQACPPPDSVRRCHQEPAAGAMGLVASSAFGEDRWHVLRPCAPSAGAPGAQPGTRASRHAPRAMRLAPCASRHAPRAMRLAPCASRHAPRAR